VNLNELLYGDLTRIATYLDTTEDPLDIPDVQAVLANLCRRVADLEKRERELQEGLGVRLS
jgi:hypothetical protein